VPHHNASTPEGAVSAHAKALLAAIVASSDDAIISKTLEGVITSWNAAAERLFGWTAAEAIGQHITFIIPHDRLGEEDRIIGMVRRGERVDHYETVRQTKSGGMIDLSITVSPVRDDDGTIIGASKVARDVTQRKAVEAELACYRESLETTVAERTAALESASRRLRAAERAAALGTLAAGVGHDMTNLLLPIFVRLETIEGAAVPADVREDLAAVRAAATYLQRLASGLRLMAIDPAEEGPAGGTELAAWWEEVDGIFQGVLPRGVRLEVEGLRERPLRVAMARHRLTQAMFNLVQNAGEAIGGRGWGTVKISMSLGQGDGGHEGVVLRVEDDGPGMSADVRARCFEPYFSTKSRTISTGMGLPLVRSLVHGAAGTIEVGPAPGGGAAFTVWLPVEPAHPNEPAAAPDLSATVSLSAPDRAAFAAAVLAVAGVRSVHRPEPEAGDALWVTDAADPEAIERFLSEGGRRVVLTAPVPEAVHHGRADVVMVSGSGAGDLRRGLVAAAKGARKCLTVAHGAAP
jgi:PAS domain S-box-containing protein